MSEIINKPKIMVFIDGTWLWHNAIALNETHNRKLDLGNLPKNLIESLDKNRPYQYVGTILCASVPTNVAPIDTELAEKRVGFFKMMQEKYNFVVELYNIDFKGQRITKSDRDPNSVFKIKEKCIDIATASNLLFHANKYDVAFLVTGDSDFIPAINKVTLWGKQVIVATFKQSCSNKFLQLQTENPRFNVVLMDDMIESLFLIRNTVTCESAHHVGEPVMQTTYDVKPNQKFFCHNCRKIYRESCSNANVFV